MNREISFFTASCIIVAVFGCMCYSKIKSRIGLPLSPDEHKTEQRVLSGIDSKSILHPSSNLSDNNDAPYKLLIFGDYECFPCYELHKYISLAIGENRKQIQILYRHYPLTRIHPHALDAAVFAEAAREQGKFRQAHELLYETHGNPSKSSIEEFIKENKIDKTNFERARKTSARHRVLEDIKIAKSIPISGTPSLLYYKPNRELSIVAPSNLQNMLRSAKLCREDEPCR